MADAHKHSSESMEHHTPPEIVEASRKVLGAIDLDPASCTLANTIVRAAKIFTREDNGLGRSWWGNVFLNPPGGLCDGLGRRVVRASKKHNRKRCEESGSCGLPPGHTHEDVDSSALVWWKKLVREWKDGDVESAIFVGFNFEIVQTTTRWSLEEVTGWSVVDTPVVWLGDRVKYLRPDVDDHGEEVHEVGAAPPGGSFLAYLPPRDPRQVPGDVRLRGAFAELGRATKGLRW